MAFIIPKTINSIALKHIEGKLLALSLNPCSLQVRERHKPGIPRLRNPTWFVKKTRTLHEDYLTHENDDFLREVAEDKLTAAAHLKHPIFDKALESTVQWQPSMYRTGVIARKVGNIPLWLKSGKKIYTTMLQVLDNQVIKYYTPEEYDPPRKRITGVKNKRGCLLLGAESTSPMMFTKEYCGLFKNTGVMPKRLLARFFIGPEAVLPAGTPISALHFSVGNFVDVRGKTVDRGFQGVMKKHGFKGMPASHGVTKTHRRPGNIGSGGQKARVLPGTKLPGHMGNRWRITRGLKIYRINTKHNVLWVAGMGIPGETNSVVYIYDTLLPLRKPSAPLAFPTYFSNENVALPDDLYADEVHRFDDPTIVFKP